MRVSLSQYLATTDFQGKHGFEATADRYRRLGLPRDAGRVPPYCPRRAACRETWPSHAHDRWVRLVTVVVRNRPGTDRIPARILVAGGDLLAGALANALRAHGFATRNAVPKKPEIGDAIEWRPNLVLVDVRSLDVRSGFAFVSELGRAELKFCVIDSADDGERENLWRVAGASALIDRSKPFDELFRTVIRVLRTGATTQTPRRSSPSLAMTMPENPADLRLKPFTVLTEREQFVLAQLIEGHCADEIATASCVSISTVRSQIKAILQKLNVKSQLAAVAQARRAGWSLESPRDALPKNRAASVPA
jgi:DNA-binding NarL/FixJ family response regulator